MLDRFITAIQKYIDESKNYSEKLHDPNRFNDEFAKNIEWTPITKVGSQFCTRRMAKLGNHIVAFLPSLSFLLFSALFIGVGGYLIRRFANIHTPLSYYFTHSIQAIRIDFHQMVNALNSDRWIEVPFASIFFLIGLIALVFALKPIYFDLRDNYFMKGFSFWGVERVSLYDIYAIQMISNPDSADDYTNYELNLVLKNKDRINVVCHSRDNIIRKQAQKLSRILSIPFWDMTSI